MPERPHAPCDEARRRRGVRASAGYSNGTRSTARALVSCEHGHGRERTEHDGSVTVIARVEGKRLTARTTRCALRRLDLVTDPSYGIDSDYEGHKAESEIGACHVYESIRNRQHRVVADDFVRPNGLAFHSTSASSMSRIPAPPRPTGRATSGVRCRGAGASQVALSSRPVQVACSTLPLDEAGRIWTPAQRRRPLLRAGRHAHRQDRSA
jgi:gluconolactonase